MICKPVPRGLGSRELVNVARDHVSAVSSPI